jgi:uncharacterized GH25 family protein
LKSFKTKPRKVRGIGNLFSLRKNEDYTTSECVQQELNTPHPFEGVEQLEYELNSNKANYRKVVLKVDTNETFLLNLVTFTATVTDSENNPLQDIPVSFYKDNVKCETGATVLTNSTGVATYQYQIRDDQAATWFFTAKAIITETDNSEIQLTSNEVGVKATKRPVNLTYPTTVKQNTSYTGKLIDTTTGNGISNQKIQIRMSRFSGESKTYTLTTDTEGYFSYPQIQLPIGEYNFVIIYEGTNIYKNAQTDMFLVEVNNDKRKSSITEVTDTIIRYSYFKAKLIDTESEQPLAEQSVNVQMVRLSDNANKTYAMTTDSNGYFSQILELYEGEYVFNISYAGNDKYEPCSQNNIKIIVTTPTQIETRINAASQVTRMQNYTGLLTDILQKGIPNKNILITMTRVKDGVETSKTYGTGEIINGVLDPYITTDSDGQFKKYIELASTQECGCKYYFTSYFEGDENYLPSRTEKKEVTVFAGDKRQSQIVAPSTVKRFTDYIGVLQDYTTETPLSEKTVNLRMERLNPDGTTDYKVYTLTTDQDGQFKIYIELTAGTYTFTGTFDGDSDYSATSFGPVEVEVTETRTKTYLTLLSNNIVFNDNIQVLLKDDSETPISNKNIVMTLSKFNSVTNKTVSKEYNATTNSNGIAGVPITLTIDDNITYYIVANFLDDAMYIKSTLEKTEFTVTPANTTLSLTSDHTGTVEPNTNVKFIASLLNQNGNPISNAQINLYEEINVIKLDTVLTLTSDKTSAGIDETVTLTAKLLDEDGNPVNGATIVFMEGSSTLYSSITNNLGVINYSYSSTVEGSKSLKCVFEGNTNYNGNVSGNVIITINKYIVFPSAYASNTGSVSVTDNVYSLQLNNMGMVGVYNAGYPLYNDESYTITCQIKNSNIYNAQCGLGVVSKTNTAYHTYIYLESDTPVYQIRVIKNYSDSYLNKQSLSTNYRNTWLNYKIVLNGTSFTYTVTDTNNTTIYSGTITLGADLNTTLYPAIFAGWDACTVQFKNLQIM